MMRNAALLLGTIAVLGVAMLAYVQWTGDPYADPVRTHEAIRSLPAHVVAGPEQSFSKVGFEIKPGADIEFTSYDDTTGRATGHYRFKSYSAVPGSNNEVHVEQPTMVVLLPNEMTAATMACSRRTPS